MPFPATLLVHGMEDETVPFTATAEAAYMLQSSATGAATNIDQVYIAKAQHQETVMHLMLGGPTRDAILEWLVALDEKNAEKSSQIDDSNASRSSGQQSGARTKTKLVVPSRL